jgi:hypothetical protein
LAADHPASSLFVAIGPVGISGTFRFPLILQRKVESALKAEAQGYILKDSAPDDLPQTIEAVYASKLLLPSELAQKPCLLRAIPRRQSRN